MRTLEFAVFINRPPQEVFDFMANPDNDTLWQKGTISSEWSGSGPVGVGSTKRVSSRFMGRKMDAEVEYTAWDRPNGYAFKATSGPLSIAGATKFEAQNNGTLVTLVGQVEASGIMKLFEGLLIRQAKKQDQSNYDRLKAILEAA